LLVACAVRGPVTRVADGETREGRPIAPEAYAAYLRASVLEARGDARGAVAELERALDEDPRSPEIVTRIGRIVCASGASGAASEAYEAFEDALSLDPDYGPAWLELARCRERNGDRAGALAAAERAVYFDASNPEATRVAARLAFAVGRPAHGFALLDGLVELEPSSREAWDALYLAALERGDSARATRARRALERLGVAGEPARRRSLDDALRAGDLARARALAVELRVGPSALAWRALDVSSHAAALEQASLVLAADPSDSDAWIAALTAADELGDERRFDEALRSLDPEPLPPSPRARAALERLVARHVGPDAAAAFERAQRSP
jgi:tetratricopeptide (TPR) repeat protein